MVCTHLFSGIRGYEDKVSTKTNKDYLIVYFEEHSGKSSNVICRNVQLASELKKGLKCNFLCELEIGKYTKFELKSITKVA